MNEKGQAHCAWERLAQRAVVRHLCNVNISAREIYAWVSHGVANARVSMGIAHYQYEASVSTKKTSTPQASYSCKQRAACFAFAPEQKNDVMFTAVVLINTIVDKRARGESRTLAHSTAARGESRTLAHSTRARGESRALAHSTRARGESRTLAHSTTAMGESRTLAHSTRARGESHALAHSTTARGESRTLAHSTQNSVLLGVKRHALECRGR
jgi:hypothetical protein